jgi:Na+/proline symporter
MPNKLTPAALATLIAVSSVAPSYAGGFAEPRIEPEVMAPEQVIAETAATSAPGGIIIPLILLALIAAVAAASSGGGGSAVPVPPIGPA